MDYDMNLYYNPEKSGYTKFGEEDTGGSYSFQITVVLEKGGELFYAQDSGCSCPTPFEDHDIGSLMPVTKESFKAFESDVLGYHEGTNGAKELTEAVRSHLKIERRGKAKHGV